MPEKQPHILPADIVVNAMTAADQGEFPPFDRAGLLEITKLDGPEPDGLTLVDRFIGPDDTMHGLVAVARAKRGAAKLIRLTNKREANPAQEAVMYALGGVAEQQILREETICPVAATMIEQSTRHDLIDTVVRDILAAHAPPPSPDHIHIGPIVCPPWKAH